MSQQIAELKRVLYAQLVEGCACEELRERAFALYLEVARILDAQRANPVTKTRARFLKEFDDAQG